MIDKLIVTNVRSPTGEPPTLIRSHSYSTDGFRRSRRGCRSNVKICSAEKPQVGLIFDLAIQQDPRVSREMGTGSLTGRILNKPINLSHTAITKENIIFLFSRICMPSQSR